MFYIRLKLSPLLIHLRSFNYSSFFPLLHSNWNRRHQWMPISTHRATHTHLSLSQNNQRLHTNLNYSQCDKAQALLHPTDTYLCTSSETSLSIIQPTDLNDDSHISNKERLDKFKIELNKMQNELYTEQSTQLGSATPPYEKDGHQTLFDIDKELGPTIDDWEIAPYYRINREMPGQTLHKAEKKDIEILSLSKWKYFIPCYSGDGLNYRLVRLSDTITSPVLRVKKNARVGVRPEGRSRILIVGFILSSTCFGLGLWQLHRIEWKRNLIQLRRNRVTAPVVTIDQGPLPWVDHITDWEYRQVQLRGVIDSRKAVLVGPRDQIDKSKNHGYESGFLVYHTLRLKDGTALLINRGHLPAKQLQSMENTECPQWVTIKGIVNPGEHHNGLLTYGFRFLETGIRGNGCVDRVFPYVYPDKLAEAADILHLKAASVAVIDVLELYFDEDRHKSPGDRPNRETIFQLTNKTAFYEFWCSEHTHFNYALQWFLFSAFAFGCCFFKWIAVHHWKF